MATTVTKTIKPSGGDYTSLSAFEAGEQRNLVTLDEISVAECYSMTDTAPAVFDGWNTGPTNYILIKTPSSERHIGIWNSGKYNLSVPSGSSSICLHIKTEYTRVEGLQFYTNHTSGNAVKYDVGGSNADLWLRYCILKGTTGGGIDAIGLVIIATSFTNQVYRVNNSLFYDFGASGAGGGVYYSANSASNILYFFNNNVHSTYKGVENINATGRFVAINNISVTSGGIPYTGSFDSLSTHNTGDSGTVPGAYSIVATPVYEDSGGRDFRLQITDASGLNLGFDLTDNIWSFIEDDIIDVSRPQKKKWDRGAFERTYTFLEEKDVAIGSRPRMLINIDFISGTLRYSDQDLDVDGVVYTTKVLSWGVIRSSVSVIEDSVKISGVNITLAEEGNVHADLELGREVTIYLWFLDTPGSEKQLFFKGRISGNIVRGLYEVSFECLDESFYFNKVIGELLSVTRFPNADVDAIGVMLPVIYGAVQNHKTIPIVAGGISTLAIEAIAPQSTLTFTDGSGFPSGSGQFTIGETVINYTSRSGNVFTLVADTSIDFAQGERVYESNITLEYLVANHPVDSITNPRILPFGSKSSKEAVAIDSGDYTVYVSFSGYSKVDLTNIPAIRRAVAVAVTQQPDQPITTQPTYLSPNHKHTDAADTRISYFFDTYDVTALTGGVASVNWPWALVDSKFTEVTAFVQYSTFSVDTFKLGVESHSGAPNNIRSMIRVVSTVGDGVTTGLDIKMKLYVEGALKETKSIKVGTSIKTESTSWYAPSGSFDWIDFNDTADNGVTIESNGSAGAHSLLIYEVWLEVEYNRDTVNTAANVNADTSAVSNRIADVLLGGNSVADTIGGDLIVDVDGYEDNGAGHYTGTPNALITKPAEIIHHIIEEHSNGAVHADIDISGTFTDTNTNLPASYQFGFAINNQIGLNDLLAKLAFQAYSRIYYERGLYKLRIYKDTTGSATVINTNTDSVLVNNQIMVNFSESSLEEIQDPIIMKYFLDYSLGDWESKEAYSKNSKSTISSFGTREKVYLFFAVNSATMALDLIGKLSLLRGDVRTIVTFPSYLKHIDLNIGDEITLTAPGLGETSVTYELLEFEFIPPTQLHLKLVKY